MLTVAEAQAIVLWNSPAAAAGRGPAHAGAPRGGPRGGRCQRPRHAALRQGDDGRLRRALRRPAGRPRDTHRHRGGHGRPDAPARRFGPGQATRIMTGAPMPAGADAVVMVERTRAEDDRVRSTIGRRNRARTSCRAAARCAAARRCCRRGRCCGRRSSACWRRSGAPAPACTRRRAWPSCPPATRWSRPAERPGPGQIRNGNGPMLLRPGGAGRRPAALPRHRPRPARQPAAADRGGTAGRRAAALRRRLGRASSTWCRACCKRPA